MRRHLLLIVIAVLCLRVWAGEVMAGQMLAQQLGGSVPAAASAEAAREHGPDCPGASADAEHPAKSAQCASCLSCQDCSMNAAPAVARLAASAPSMHAQLAAPAPFDSAEPLSDFKPPIA